MIKRLFTLLLSIMISVSALADAETDREMARISRDRDTYISADARAATESEARDEAFRQLGSRVSDYLKVSGSGMTLTEATNEFQTLTSQIASDRFRVMVYVNKSDLGGKSTQPSSHNDSKYAYNDDEEIRQAPEGYSEVEDNAHVVEITSNSALQQILSQGTKSELTRCLESLSKSHEITAAAAFPVANASDFYLVILQDNQVRRVVHCINGHYIDAETSAEIDINKYSRCTGYWFTLPK